MTGLTACILFLVALRSLLGSILHFTEHEAARRRAARIEFPPMRTVETADEIPF